MEKARRGRGTVERRGMPEGSGSLSRRGPYCCHGTTTAQKLGKDFFATFIFSFQRGAEPHRFSISDQEAMCLLFAQGNPGGLSTT